jgi:nucleotide-binding universal stress UspA family protein
MYKTILCTIDLEDQTSWEKALPTAIEYCQTFGAKLWLMTVVPDFGSGIVSTYFPEDFASQAIAETKAKLTTFASEHVPAQIEYDTLVTVGTVYDEIVTAAEGAKVDLIVMASHRPALRDYLIGPNASRVVRHANCSVLIVRN